MCECEDEKPKATYTSSSSTVFLFLVPPRNLLYASSISALAGVRARMEASTTPDPDRQLLLQTNNDLEIIHWADRAIHATEGPELSMIHATEGPEIHATE